MKKLINNRLLLIILLASILSFGTITVFATDQTDEDKTSEEQENSEEENVPVTDKDEEATANGDEENSEEEQVENAQPVQNNVFPTADAMDAVAENDKYVLKADTLTGHFILINKETDQELRSFPDPSDWTPVGIAPAWKYHLQSPFMVSYVEMNIRRDMLKETNFTEAITMSAFEPIEDGFRITYELTQLGFIIPVEVRLGEDYVETKVLSDEIKDEKENEEGGDEEEDPMARLVAFRLFPFLGADSSSEEDGYLFLPDGSGVLVNFKQNRASSASLYSEKVYGEDWAYSFRRDQSTRSSVRMPVFGIKSGNQATLGVIHEGDVYAKIVSAPSQSFSHYNWVTGEHVYRSNYYQPTNRQRTEGYYTYSEKMQRTDRSIRYYPLEGEDPGYVDMAQRYRQYLMEEQGVQKVEPDDENLDLQLNLLGGGTKEGFLWDSFLTLTPLDEAKTIVQELSSLGVANMSITYLGWQDGGYSQYGGHFPVARKLGGNNGMEEFVEFAHSKGYDVHLDASSYTFNNTGDDGFRPNRDGLRDQGNSIIQTRRGGGDNTYVSPLFMKDVIYNDLEKAKELGVDGLVYGDGVGSWLSTDYNERYYAERHEVKQIQEEILARTKEVLGDVQVNEGNFYTLEHASHMHEVDSDYSYDLFVDREIPFVQMVLHGLSPYSFDYVNLSGNVDETFLKGLEYGAIPSFILTARDSQHVLESRSLRRFYSTYYKDWQEEIAAQYQDYNEALGDVQDLFITDHQELAAGVNQTTYENGKQIIVNYNNYSYKTDDGVEVEPKDFIVIKGGAIND